MKVDRGKYACLWARHPIISINIHLLPTEYKNSIYITLLPLKLLLNSCWGIEMLPAMAVKGKVPLFNRQDPAGNLIVAEIMALALSDAARIAAFAISFKFAMRFNTVFAASVFQTLPDLYWLVFSIPVHVRTKRNKMVQIGFLYNLASYKIKGYMTSDEEMLIKAKKLIELKVNWGQSSAWVNQDFIALSKKIQEETGASISHITLKRIWGKVNYDGLPQVYTLNTLVKYLGFESWRDFLVKNETSVQPPGTSDSAPKIPSDASKHIKIAIVAATLLAFAIGIVILKPRSKKGINPRDFSFSSRKTINVGIPNSVVFDFDATKSSGDSITIQQSWDTLLRTRLSRQEHQHTLIYYFPGFFKPKLIVDGQIVKEHDLLITSDGWVTALMTKPTPVYFKKTDVMSNGKMSLPINTIKAQNIAISPAAPSLSYCYVKDFGHIYSDDFIFETSLKNDFRGGSSVCQMTNIYLLCEGTAINIPLCAKGCESALNFFFTSDNVSGKKHDLSSFGVDFKEFIKVKIESANGKASIFVNNKLAYRVNHGIARSKIIGIDFVFQGTGSVDYVKLHNKQVTFDDEFSK